MTQWWRDAVIYQIYIRSFADGNGDGVGDFAGIAERLPHVADLGVDAIWITPFYPSPMADGGYDVADFRDVDPLFGSLADFDRVLAEAHAAGLRVIIDLVPNHTSDQHPWFTAGLWDRYIVRPGVDDGPPNDWESVFGGPAWTQLPSGDWYLHLFAPEQPDLNWNNPDVRAEFEDVLRFWLDRGVDGFRVDVAHGLFKHPDLPSIGHADQIELLGSAALPYFDRDEVHDVYRSWRKILDSYDGSRILVAEAWVPGAGRLARYVRPDEMHQAFNFAFLGTPWNAAELRSVVDSSLAAVAAVDAPCTWVLSNHDVVRHATRYGGGAVGLRRARAAALLMLALPGSAYVYQGEELGLEEVTDLPDEVLQDPTFVRSGGTKRGRDGCRVPLPWSGTAAPFGFGPTSWLPMPARWASSTAAAQEGDPTSTLSLYRAALRLRRSHHGDGELRWLPSPPDVLSFAVGGLTCVVNLSSEAVPVPSGYAARVLSSTPPADPGSDPRHVEPDTAAWFA